MDWFASLLLDVLWMVVFGLIFYVALPDTLNRVHDTPINLKLKRGKGLSSLWLIWPFVFGIVTTTLLLVPPTAFEYLLFVACLLAGYWEAQRILRISVRLWARANGIRIEGEAAPKGS